MFCRETLTGNYPSFNCLEEQQHDTSESGHVERILASERLAALNPWQSKPTSAQDIGILRESAQHLHYAVEDQASSLVDVPYVSRNTMKNTWHSSSWKESS